MKCLNCGTHTNNVCPVCKKNGVSAPICSSECQKLIWSTHKLEHAQFQKTKGKRISGAKQGIMKKQILIDGFTRDDCCDESSSSAINDVISKMSPDERNMYDILRDLVSKFRTGRNENDNKYRSTVISGVLDRLQNADSQTFLDIIFPGRTVSDMSHMSFAGRHNEDEALPTSLPQLLQWRGMDAALTNALPETARNAARILDGAKARGERQGQVMDAMTKRLLSPQIAGESLGRTILALVRKASAVVSELQRAALQVANPADAETVLGAEPATDMLDYSTIDAYMRQRLHQQQGQHRPSGKRPERICGGQQRSFIGKEWAQLVRSDFSRFTCTNAMARLYSPSDALRLTKTKGIGASPSSSTVSSLEGGNCDGSPGVLPRVAWVNDPESLTQFPALLHLCQVLQGLPFELNAKTAHHSQDTTTTAVGAGHEPRASPARFLELGCESVVLVHCPVDVALPDAAKIATSLMGSGNQQEQTVVSTVAIFSLMAKSGSADSRTSHDDDNDFDHDDNDVLSLCSVLGAHGQDSANASKAPSQSKGHDQYAVVVLLYESRDPGRSATSSDSNSSRSSSKRM